MARRKSGRKGKKGGRGKAVINSPFHPVFGGRKRGRSKRSR